MPPTRTAQHAGKRVLVLWADDRSTNLGVRALASGTARLIGEAFPGSVVAFQSYEQGVAPLPINTRTILKACAGFDRRTIRWLQQYDLVIDTGAGDSFADIYGLGRLLQMTGMRIAVARARVPLVLGPQTIGPFNTRLGRALARWTTRRSLAVFARDHKSAAYAREVLGLPVSRATDVAFGLPPADVDSPPRDVLFNASGLLWNPNPHVDYEKYREAVLRCISDLKDQGRTVTLLTHVISSDNPDSDEIPIPDILASHPDLEVLRPTTLGEAREQIASAKVVIGARMHACLNALSQGVPAVAWAYSRKFEPLLNELGWPHVIDLEQVTTAPRATKSAVEEPALATTARQVQARATQIVDATVKHIRDLEGAIG
ncbi:polysaccharide pyruvyl transferase family protein [Microbacterium aureliae]